MKTTVIFHSADFDGIFCREIAKKFLTDAELIGWNHGDPKLPFPSEGDVYVLDLSPECFDEMPAKTGRLIWIDHHKSSIEKFNPGINGYRIDGVAACRLAWQWFAQSDCIQCKGWGFVDVEKYDKVEQVDCGFCSSTGIAPLPEKEDFIDRKVIEPLAVRLAGEYDIWDKRDPDAELFQHGLRSVPLTDGIWEELLEPKNLPGAVRVLLDNGLVLQFAKREENESIITDIGFTIQFEGLTFLACNAARYNSHLFTAGLKPEHDACFGFKWTGKTWSVSLYHAPGKEHHDLSLIATKYGGGGHRGACGFQTSKLPFLA